MIISGLLCGILLGFVMQRGRFCITGAFRDIYLTKNSKMFIAFLIIIAVQAAGVLSLQEAGILAPLRLNCDANWSLPVWCRNCVGWRLFCREPISSW